MLSLVFFVSAFVVIPSISAVNMFSNLCLFMFLLGSVFPSLTSSETSLSIYVFFVLLRAFSIEAESSFSFSRLYKTSGLKKIIIIIKIKKPREKSRHFTNGPVA